MDAATISILIALVGCFVGLAGWLSGRDKKISNDAEWKGAINAKLDVICGISQDVKRLEDMIHEQGKQISSIDASAKQAHHRIDEIIGALKN